MTSAARSLTYHDLESILEQEEGERHELVDGELIVTPPPSTRHQTVSSNIVYALERIARERNLGRVYTAPTGVRLTPDTVLVPDVAFVSLDRLHVVGPKTIDAVPDLDVEILSPGTRRRDREAKRSLYARFGVQEYSIVDPEARIVTVLALAGNHYEEVPLGGDGRIVSRVLPALAERAEDFFSGAN